MKPIFRVTIDTGIINSHELIPELNEIHQLAANGKITLLATERLLLETNEKAFEKAQSLEYIGEPFVLGESPLGTVEGNRGGRLVSVEDLGTKPDFHRVKEILFPTTSLEALTRNQKNDIMHLLGHSYSDSDIFVTNNPKCFIDDRRKGFGKDYKKNRLLQEFGIRVMTCSEFLDYARELT